MKNLFFALVFVAALVVMTSFASAQCGGRSYGYRTSYYAPAPVVVVPRYSYAPAYYGYSPQYSVGYGSYYGGVPAYRAYYGGNYGRGYGYGYGYPRSGISISFGGYGW